MRDRRVVQDSKIQINNSIHKSFVSFGDVKNKPADNSYYFKQYIYQINRFIVKQKNNLSNFIYRFIPSDNQQASDFSYYSHSLFAAIAPVIIGELTTYGLSQNISDNDNANYFYRFGLSAAVLGFSALYRITDKKIESDSQYYCAAAAEAYSIANLYFSTYRLSKFFFDRQFSDSYSLIASLGVSVLAVPGCFALLAKRMQELLVKSLYEKGAQRSDKALISAGLTAVENTWLLFAYTLIAEMSPASRQFQLGLISDNILNLKGALKRFRNLPALIADAGPQILDTVITLREKIEKDYQYNTAKQNVLAFQELGLAVIKSIERHKLRTGDLVRCDEAFDMDVVPVCGDVISLQQDEKSFLNKEEELKFCSNHKVHNGEDVWIEYKTNGITADKYKKVNLAPIREGKHAGVLTGAKLNLYGGKNFFIRIKEQAERPQNTSYAKNSVIDQIIIEHKKRSVKYSFILSLSLSALLSKDVSSFSLQSIYLMFNLFQMMIPFSETVLRKTVNWRMLKEINAKLDTHKMTTIDALRIVDLSNALGGYYSDKFAQGVAIVSDKTGTLTTPHMDVKGLWTTECSANGIILKPAEEQYLEIFEIFTSAYTNSKKELEPEEFALLKYFSTVFINAELSGINTLGSQHYRKKLLINNVTKTIETLHLGLYRKFGGRFTLAQDQQKYFLIFCGIPRAETFNGTQLFEAYQKMNTRLGVLSRDWCIARTEMDEKDFLNIKNLLSEDNKTEIEKYLLAHKQLISQLKHYSTFIIDNPVKQGAEKFISRCKLVDVPVFVATGDTAKSAENIAKVLCPEACAQIVTIKASDLESGQIQNLAKGSTLIFSGINDAILVLFKSLLLVPISLRPNIIFSEMSTEGKGVLARFLKDNGFFVVANGDGTNDVAMMREAHTVIAHLAEDGTYAPDVEELANLNDKQLQLLSNSKNSFYELFNIDCKDHNLARTFTRLANSQEKPSIALLLKSSKMSFEMVKAVGVTDVKEMWQQHWCSVIFDLIWLGISYFEIVDSADLPADNKHLVASNSLNVYLLGTMVYAGVMSMVNYAAEGESTNVTSMVVTLGLLDLFLKLIFNAFGHYKNEPEKEEVTYTNNRLFKKADRICIEEEVPPKLTADYKQ